MKSRLFLALLVLLAGIKELQVSAQQQPSFLIRAYWDNDLFNVRGQGTDESYTNGFRFDVFHIQKRSPRNFLDRILPVAGDSSINVRGWGLGQMMMTPTDLTVTTFQPQDYSYAGALVGIHSFYSYNAKRKYAFQTEVMLGVRGPKSFTAQTQIFIHRLIGDQRPMGWDNQLPGQFIANITFTAEKELLHVDKIAEVIMGAQVMGGTLFNQAAAFTTLRIGKMVPYFNGYISQHSSTRKTIGENHKHIQAYLIVRPAIGVTIDNDMLYERPDHSDDTQTAGQPVPSLERWSKNLEYGIEINAGRVSLSFIQKSCSPMWKGFSRHEVGNIAMYYSW